MKKFIFLLLALFSIFRATSQPFPRHILRISPPAVPSDKPFTPQYQVWPKIYPTPQVDLLEIANEAYDKGYLFMGNECGNIYNGYYYKNYPFVLKTDVNGNILWQKWVSYLGSQAPVYPEVYSFGIGLQTCADGGFILSGGTYAIEHCAYDPYCTDAFIMKVNACGEKEWCSIIQNIYSVDYGMDAIEAENGDIWLLAFYGNLNYLNQRVWIYCFDALGNLKWKQFYPQGPGSKTADETGMKLIPSPPGNMLIGADGGLKDTLNPNVAWAWEPIMFMIDSTGGEDWVRPLSYEYLTDIVTSGNAFCRDANGNFWVGGSVRYFNGTSFTPFPSCLFQMHKGGYPMAYYLIDENTQNNAYSGIQTLVCANDHTFFVLDSWGGNNVGYQNAMLIDTSGTVLKNQHLEIPVWNDGLLNYSIKTSDNKFVSAGWNWTSSINKFDMLIDKLTPELEHDALDLRPLVYDSLCPHPIRSDTLKLDCRLIVGLDEIMTDPNARKLRIFPNPANSWVTIELPEAWVTETPTPYGALVRANYIWPADMVVNIYDVSGRLVKSFNWPDRSKSMQIDVSSLPAHIYMFRLLSKHQSLADGKLMIVK